MESTVENNHRKAVCIILILAAASASAAAQPEKLDQVWPARWITSQEGPWKEYSVHRFRKGFELDTLPGSLTVHTSADNRYRLFVNGHQVTRGPQLGDLDHWYYETTDIAPFLRMGKNVIAAEVLNYGSRPPDYQLSVQTAFLLAAGDRRFRSLNSGNGWKAIPDPSYTAALVDRSQLKGYYGGGSREQVDGRTYHWGWELPGFPDGSWKEAKVVETAFARTCTWASRWKLTPRTLPHEQIVKQRFRALQLAEGLPVKDGEGLLRGDAPLRIPPHSRVRLVFDQGAETTAYPEIHLSGGEGALVRLKYVEAPVLDSGNNRIKGNRNVIEGKSFLGYEDRYMPAGSGGQVYKPFWWRAFRYVELTVETGSEALVLEDFFSHLSTYPFEQRADLKLGGIPQTDADTIARILEIGDRTLRLCAHESFMDCPYYEESQFPGDTRIQALAAYLHFGDARLAKNAIEQFSWSLNGEGFISARYPTNSTYYIPNYNIYWIGMLHDYMMFKGDSAFVASQLPVVRYLMDYFLRRARADGTISRPGYHNFVDWTHRSGEAPFDSEGYSSIVDLHVLLGLQWAARLEAFAGDPELEWKYRKRAGQLMERIPELYFHRKKGLFADTPEMDSWSVHANTLAIITGAAGEMAGDIMKIILDGSGGMVGSSIYWRFYMSEALDRSGRGDHYLQWLEPWKEMIRAGVTTWPETGPESRSECHGWGASPNYHLYATVAGIRPQSPGFSSVIVRPHPGNASSLTCVVPHPGGRISLELRFSSGRSEGTILLPEGVDGTYHWKGKQQQLAPGSNRITL